MNTSNQVIIKIYDYLGNLNIKMNVSLSVFENDIFYLSDLVKEVKVIK